EQQRVDQRHATRSLHVVQAQAGDEADVARDQREHAGREEAQHARGEADADAQRSALHQTPRASSMADASDESFGAMGPVFRHRSTPSRSIRKVAGTPTMRNCVDTRSPGSRQTGKVIWNSCMKARMPSSEPSESTLTPTSSRPRAWYRS